MPDDLPLKVGHTPGTALDVNLVGQSPHVFAYRMWFREPSQDSWTLFLEGHTSDDKPEHKSVGPFPDGTQIIAWVSAGGTKPGFKYLLTFGQEGAILPGGAILKQGKIKAGTKVLATKTTVELI